MRGVTAGTAVEERTMFWGTRLACALLPMISSSGWAAEMPGVKPTEIRIGGIFPFSGAASSIGQVGRGVQAYVQSINDRGGINGRMINYITLDDAYSPPKAFEHARRLVESDEIAFMFGQLGTAGNSAVAKYLAAKKVPTIAIVTGASKFANVKDYPLTTTGLVSYDTEGKIYAKYLTRTLPSAKYAILFQNDDLGRDYVNAFKTVLGADFDRRVVTASYEVTEPTVELPGGRAEKLRRAGAVCRGHAEVCGASDPARGRDRVESNHTDQLPVLVDRRHAEAGGSGEFHRCDRRHAKQGSERPELEG